MDENNNTSNDYLVTPETVNKIAEKNVNSDVEMLENESTSINQNINEISAQSNVQNIPAEKTPNYTDINTNNTSFQPINNTMETNGNNIINQQEITNANNNNNNTEINNTNAASYSIAGLNSNSESNNNKLGKINVLSVIFFIGTIINYFLIAPLIEKFLAEKMLSTSTVSAIAAKAGVQTSSTFPMFICGTLLIFYAAASFSLSIIMFIDMFLDGKLYYRSSVSKTLGISLALGFITMIITMACHINIMNFLIKVFTLNGGQLFLFN